MKPCPIIAGDRILVKPGLSHMPEHWGEFHHIARGGCLLYWADNRGRGIMYGASWKEILEIKPRESAAHEIATIKCALCIGRGATHSTKTSMGIVP